MDVRTAAASEVVIDTSAVLAVLLHEPQRSAVIARTEGAMLLAPGSLSWEVGNVLIAGFRRKRLEAAEIRDAWASFEQIPVRSVAVAVGKALELAQQLRLYAYDAYVIEAARSHRTPIVTVDRRLRVAAMQLGLEVWELMP